MAGKYRVIQLRNSNGVEQTIEIESGFATISDAIDYCNEHDPSSTLGYRAEGQATFQVVAVYPSGNRYPVRDPHETRGFAEIHRDACMRERDERDTWTYEIEEVPAQLTTVKRRTDDYPGALSSQAEEGWVIVDAKTGGYMAGPYVTEEFADSVRTLCDEIPNTRVERARII